MSLELEENAALGSRTTLGVGGRARARAEAANPAEVAQALAHARREGWDFAVLGDGSNVIVGDHGYPGLILHYTDAHLEIDSGSGRCRAAAGLRWDDFVQSTVDQNLAGLETTVGIPGRVGAAPVQNVGAYGQELSEVLVALETIDLHTGEVRSFSREQCDFDYRDSRFKSLDRGRYLITAIEVLLAPGGAANLAYAEVARSFEAVPEPPTLAAVARRVRELRRKKGMLLEGSPEDLRSAGSFFTNPILGADAMSDLHYHLRSAGHDPGELPLWPLPEGGSKVSAAWLIQNSGFRPGHREGKVGLSPHHVLALVADEGARTEELLVFARRLRDRVRECFGVRLRPEPIPLGIDAETVSDLWG